MQTPRSSFRYKKRLGQHFLKNKLFARKIVDFAKIDNEVVLEIGAGKGILTKFIAERAKKVYANEIDSGLIENLKSIDYSNVTVVNKDFLKLDLKKFRKPIIVGNIPYFITTQILEKLTEQINCFKRAILTIQKEYGERILAKVNSRQSGSITHFINYHFSARKGFIIPAKYFYPKPKVSSVVISLIKKKPPFVLKDKERFFEFIRGIFRYRRKSVKNAIKNYLHRLPEGIDSHLLKKRPENLTLSDFKKIYDLAIL
jgi:16S rRNA (adenine1518-N6/adenine1519-N6)-dimethyltransferase